MKITEAQVHKLICQICILGLVGTSVIAICDGMDKNHYDRRDEQSVAQVYRDLDIKVTHHDFVDNSEKVFTENKFTNPTTTRVMATKSIDKKLNLDCGIGRTEKYIREIVHKNYREEVDKTNNNSNVTNESKDDCETNDHTTDDYTFETLPLPYGDSSFLMFMDYRALTDTTSKQWELQQYAWTDSDGFRRINNDYCVALGTVYGEIGDRFIITTDEGNTYTAIMSDVKGTDAVFYDDIHSWYHYAGNGCNVVEFVVQTEYLPSAVTISGSCGAVDYLSGNIVNIERV